MKNSPFIMVLLNKINYT